MATASDIINTPITGLNHIDALLDIGPDWNYLTENNSSNILFYTFSIASGNETTRSGQEAFSAAQQASARTAFTYLQQVTGIEFRETGSGTQAQFHLANLNLEGAYTTGLASWQSRTTGENPVVGYSANVYVYLDNTEWRAMTQNLTPGGQGYETLLHELGHALGLKHPFEQSKDVAAVLPGYEDNTSNTLMSYTGLGGYYSEYRPYDIAALNWLYGQDGLRGELGINSTTGGRYLTGSSKDETLMGTQFNDKLQGNGGNDMIDGGAGTDTVVFNGRRDAYSFTTLADGALAASSGIDGYDTLRNIELLQFADMTVERANVTADTVAPMAPVMAVTQNSALYARGNLPAMNGTAEANSMVKVYLGDQVIATALADANGLWSARSTVALADGFNYRVHSTATDTAGNVSLNSNIITFHVDATAPSVPTLTATLGLGGNRPVFSGIGEAGTTIELYRDGDFTKIGSALVGADGKWTLASQPLPNGSYNVIVTSLDAAGNARAGQSTTTLTISHNGYQAGTDGRDTITMNPGSTAVNGGAGIDTVVINGSVADYAVKKEVWGYTVTAGNGEVDGLFNVERIQFNDGWKAIDNNSAQIFRLYQAVLDRPAEAAGLGFWTNHLDIGTTLHTIAEGFMEQPEFDTLYGVDPSNEQFIYKLYENVLDRAPDAGGLLYWMSQIDNIGRAQLMIEFSESPENQALVIDTVGRGLDFVPYG